MTVTPLMLAVLLAAGPTHVDLRPAFDQWQLPPRSQGSRPTCSIFTVTGGLEYALACRTGQGVPLSAEYLNWAAHAAIGRPGDGSFFWMATDGYQKYGICPDRYMPYQTKFDPDRQPGDEALSHAGMPLDPPLAVHWIKENGSPRGLSDDEVARIKQTIRSGWPVCAGASHSVMYVGYHEDPDFPGWRYFITRDSGLGRYGTVAERTSREIVCDALWISAPGANPPAPSHTDPDSGSPMGPVPSLKGDELVPAWTVQVDNDSLSSLAFSAEGRMLAAGWRHPCDSRLYDASDGGFIGTVGSDVMCVAFPADGQRIVSGTRKIARLASIADGQRLGTLEGHTDWVEAAACPLEGDWLATGSGDRTVRIWAADGTSRQVLSGATGPISQIWISPDGHFAAASSWDHTVRVWSVTSGELVTAVPQTDAAAFMPDSRGLAVGRDSLVEFVRFGQEAPQPSITEPGRVMALAYSPDGQYLAVGHQQGRLALYAASASRGEVKLDGRVARLTFSPDGARLAAGTDRGRVNLFDVGPIKGTSLPHQGIRGRLRK